MTVWIGKITEMNKTDATAILTPDQTYHPAAQPVEFNFGSVYQENGIQDALRSQATVIASVDDDDDVQYLAYPNQFGIPPAIPGASNLPLD